MKRRILFILILISQSACFVMLPLVEQDKEYNQDQPLSCNLNKQARLKEISPVEKALKNLTSPIDAVRTTAATELGFIAEGNSIALQALKTASWQDRSKWVRRAAVKSVYKLAGRDAIPTLKNALKDSDPWVVHSAKNALASLN